ncbi:MAG: guanylate kinase [Selenomonadaceae bacterium]|jgi:guanylate kinase
MKQGNLIVISGPSGTGKGTICQALLVEHPEILYSISATTRQPRTGEVNGINYWFTAKDDFKAMIENNELLEWAEVYGNYYGTPIAKIEEMLAGGKDVLLEIDTQGAMNVKKKFPQGVYIYILPPSLMELERRIRNRGTDSEESIHRRLQAAADEIQIGVNYNYLVVNDQVRSATDTVAAIIAAERWRTERNLDILEKISK